MKTYLKTNNVKAQRAFTMIEVMVAVGVLGIVLLALFASFSFGFSVVKLSREELRATQILQERTEAVRLYSWNQITNTTFVPSTFQEPLLNGGPVYFSGTLSITPVTLADTTYSSHMRQVFVTISWTNGTKRTRSTSTFVSHYGLQNYVFNTE